MITYTPFEYTGGIWSFNNSNRRLQIFIILDITCTISYRIPLIIFTNHCHNICYRCKSIPLWCSVIHCKGYRGACCYDRTSTISCFENSKQITQNGISQRSYCFRPRRHSASIGDCECIDQNLINRTFVDNSSMFLGDINRRLIPHVSEVFIYILRSCLINI